MVLNLDHIRGTERAIVTPLIGRDYLRHLVYLIDSSERSVWLTAFQASGHVVRKGSKAARLFKSVTDAWERGCDVRVLVHMPRFNKKIFGTNKGFINALQDKGIPYRLLLMGETLHAKMFILDAHMSVIGSHNLTDRALWTNYEASVVIDSAEVTAVYKSFFDNLWERGTEGEQLP